MFSVSLIMYLMIMLYNFLLCKIHTVFFLPMCNLKTVSRQAELSLKATDSSRSKLASLIFSAFIAVSSVYINFLFSIFPQTNSLYFRVYISQELSKNF